MKKQGFDNDKYLAMQSAHIKERIAHFGGTLYLEFGGKLFDDYHASRVLPGFAPDSKVRMLAQMKDEAEIIIVISAGDIEKNKVRADIGITYDMDVLRLIDAFRGIGLYVGSVAITQYAGQAAADAFKKRLIALGVQVYTHYPISGYPSNVPLIVSDEGYGHNDYIETTRPLVVVTAPGPGSGKMATCLSQLYHEYKRGVSAGYAKFETFPVWNLPLKHPVNLAYEAATADLNDVNMIDPFHLETYGQTAVNYNRDVEIFPVVAAIFEKIAGESPYHSPTDMGVNLAYEAATADLNDVNMIDPFHLEAYGETTVNYNRDVEIFPVLNAMFQRIYDESPYKSPTDMGVNMAGNCICDDTACREASCQEIIRRYFQARCDVRMGRAEENGVHKIELLMNQAKISQDSRPIVATAETLAEQTGNPAAAIQLEDGEIITGKTSSLLGASAAALLNALKHLAGLPDELHLLPPLIIEPIQRLKTHGLGNHNPRLHTDEVLIALSISAATNPAADLAIQQLANLKGCEVHSSVILAQVDDGVFHKLGMNLTCSPVHQTKKLYHK